MATWCRQVLAVYLVLSVVAIGSLPIPAAAFLVSSGGPAASDDLAAGRHTQTLLEAQRVAQRLVEIGLTPDEAQSRLASLPDEQIRTLAQQLDVLEPGGSHWPIVGVLGGIALIVLGVLAITGGTTEAIFGH